MIIIKTILFWFLMILVAIILLLIIFCIIPLKYELSLTYKSLIFSLRFKFWFFNFSLKIGFGSPFTYKARIMWKVIADSSKKKKNDEGESVGDTDFIHDKTIENEVNIGRHATKEIVKRAKEYNEELFSYESETVDKMEKEKEVVEKGLLSFIDSFKKYLPLDLIDAAKIITHEWMGYYKQLLPRKIIMNTEFGLDDPYSVGVVLAFLSPLYSMYGKNMKVKPHFDKYMLSSDIHIIGWPQIIFIIIPVIKLLLNERFREIFFGGNTCKKA